MVSISAQCTSLPWTLADTAQHEHLKGQDRTGQDRTRSTGDMSDGDKELKAESEMQLNLSLKGQYPSVDRTRGEPELRIDSPHAASR